MISLIQANITPIVGFLTLISNIVFVGGILLMFFMPAFRAWVYRFVHTYVLELLFVGSTAAIVGSLVYSQIVGFPPCDLCWIQRIFMYPQAILLFFAMIKKDRNMVAHLLPLSILGAGVALFHSYIQWGGESSLAPCVATGGACAKVFVLEYGYITIPFMALTVFAYLIALSVIYFRSRKIHEKATTNAQ